MSASVRLAVLGDPLAFTRSPELHRAGAAALGLACESVALRTAPGALAATLDRLEAEGYRGVSLTHPHKAPVVALAGRVSEAARLARSVNTVAFGPDGRRGETTDGVGFVDLLATLGRDPARARTLLLGAGGAARSLALALHDAGAAPVTVSARDPDKRARTWSDVPAAWAAWRGADEQAVLAAADVVVNCTPLTSAEGPAPLDAIAPGALVMDLVYGPSLTRWVVAARASGLEAYDGLGLLVHQARHAIAWWFDRPVPVEPLAEAVGWPR